MTTITESPARAAADYIAEAHHAVPEFDNLTAALAAAGARATAVRETQPDAETVGLAASLADQLAAGEAWPEDAPAHAWEATQADPRRRAELLLLDQVTNELHARRDAAMNEHGEHALAVLREHLATLLAEARPVVAQLGAVRTPEEAFDAGDDAVTALKAARELAARYTQLLYAQFEVTRAALTRVERRRAGGAGYLGDLPMQSAVTQHGHFATPQATPPGDPVALLCFAADPANGAEVADLDTLRARAEGRATTDDDEELTR